MKISAPWAIDIADIMLNDREDQALLKAWIWCDRIQWICITIVIFCVGVAFAK